MLTLCLCLLLLFLESRPATAQDDLPPLQTLDIPVRVDENSRYGVQVNMSTGNQPQTFMFALSTGTGYSVVAGSECTSCAGVKGYNASASSTSHISPDTQNVVVANVQATGNLVRENCALHQANGSAWAYPNQTIVVAKESESMFTPGISGIFGLGTNGRDGNFSETVFGGWMKRNPSRSNFTYGMALKPRDKSLGKDTGDGGVLHWIKPDATFYTGEVGWNKLSPFNKTAKINTDWFVNMNGWGFKGGDGAYNIGRSEPGLQAFLDPWVPQIVFPQRDAETIYQTIPGAKILTKTPLVNVWSVPCSAKMNLTFTFGSFSTWMDESKLVVGDGDQCTGVLVEWAAPTATEYLLGSAFISAVYLIFSLSSSQDGQLGLASRASVTTVAKINTVSIIGISIGSAAFVIIVVALIILIILYRRRTRDRKNSDGIHTVTPFTQPLRSPTDKDPLWASATGMSGSPRTSPGWGATTSFAEAQSQTPIPSPSFYPPAVASSPMHPYYGAGPGGESVPPSYHPGTYVVYNPATPTPDGSPNSSPTPLSNANASISQPPVGRKKKDKMGA